MLIFSEKMHNTTVLHPAKFHQQTTNRKDAMAHLVYTILNIEIVFECRKTERRAISIFEMIARDCLVPHLNHEVKTQTFWKFDRIFLLYVSTIQQIFVNWQPTQHTQLRNQHREDDKKTAKYHIYAAFDPSSNLYRTLNFS